MAQATMAELLARLDTNPITGVPTLQHIVDAYKAGVIDNDEAKRLQDKVTKRESRVADDYLRSQGYGD
jgi:type III secretory pathway component EscV